MNEKKYDFGDETQLYYELVYDAFEDALCLLWERGEHDQREEDLNKQWKIIQPFLKDAFVKARKWDNYWNPDKWKLPGHLIIKFDNDSELGENYE